MGYEVFLTLLSSLFFGAIFAPGPRDPNSTKDPAILSTPQPGEQSRQRQVDKYFDVRAQDWKAIYVNENLRSRIYQERQA
ncbi:MAG TPA: hypothetical protein VFM10_01245, partial [Terriglobales bacterium]|nr:hypothetical protein [Terriglobales bacterium]